MSKLSQTFDVIVIGAGSSGCVVAGRLAGIDGLRILLLEAGGAASDPWLAIPGGYVRMLQDNRVDWGYVGAAEDGLGGRQIRHRRGKVLGGSSAINGMVYIRGAAADYDGWAADLGDPTWNYEHVLPLFRRSEDNLNIQDAYHGVGGPLAVARPTYTSGFTEAFLNAAAAAGLPANPDFNGKTMDGAGYYQLTARGLRRSSSADFLRVTGPNLEVRLHQQVARVLLQGERAIGVELMDESGNLTAVHCDRAVVLCAGAINTPAILQRSGIGAATLLQKLGVAVVLDNPEVGANLQDHLQVKVMFETDSADSLNTLQRRVVQNEVEPDSNLDALSVGAGIAGLFARPGDTVAPDIQFHVLPYSEETPGNLHGFAGVTASVCSLQPLSRGSVAITDSNPSTAPSVHCSYLSVAGDILPLRRGLRLLGRLAELMPAIKSVVSPVSLQSSDDALDDYVKTASSSIFHPVGTCAMSKSAGVVDSRLKVKGIDSLWIADASVMPVNVSGNTNAACIMVGERAADEIASALYLPCPCSTVAGSSKSATAVRECDRHT